MKIVLMNKNPIIFLVIGLFFSTPLLLTSCHLVDNSIKGVVSIEEPSVSNGLSIETQSNGQGTEITSKSLIVGETLNIYAVERSSTGEYVNNVEVSWVLNGGIGNLNILSSGKEAQYQASAQGTTEIKATYNGLTKTLNLNISALASSFSHGGWNDVVALGPKTNSEDFYIQADALGTITLDIAESDMKISFSWNDFIGDTADGYGIFKSTVSGTQDYFSPIATISSPSIKTYTDVNIIPGTVYYYVVRPLKQDLSYSTSEVFSEIRITAPPPNMGLVHRWIANQEVCGLMGKIGIIDPTENYRCPFTGHGNTGNFYDLGYDLLVDRFEMGCNYTKSACGGTLSAGSDCTAADIPQGNVTASVGDVYYRSTNATCYVNGPGATDWKAANGATNGDLAFMISSKAHLPPLVRIDQEESFGACEQLSINIDDGGTISPLPKRLLRQKEWRAAAAWSPVLDDGTISNIESDGDVDGHCNTDYLNRVTRDLDANIGMGYDMFHTGSQATSDMGTGSNKCVSRYGLQDMVGNVYEWTSDQCNFNGSFLCEEPGTLLDPGNGDLWTAASDWTAPSVSSGLLGTGYNTHFSPTLGLPLSGSEDGAVDSTSFDSKYHGDYFYISSSALRGLFVGGNWVSGARSGRWISYWFISPSFSDVGISARCAAPMP